ncbi:MAG: glycosyltransferase family 1 protein [Verrucomicrobia bacterium]|nr:MAG: glycosyltransferase family 1 protein [Verrucomicrobiota bacterium]
MKIQVITDTYAPDINGVAMTLGRLCEGLRRRGHEVAITHTAARCSAGEERVFSLPLLGYPGVRLGLPKPFKMRMRWKQQPPDAIYVATESPLGKSAIKAAKVLGIPVITGFHTNFDQYMEPYRLGGLKPLAMSYLRRFHRLANCTLVPTLEVKKRLTEEGFSNVHCLGRGVDTQLYSPAHRCDELRRSWGADAQSPVAIMVGRVAAEKNFTLGIRTFQALRHADPTTQCVVVGDGPLRKALQEEHPWITFCGMREGMDLARHYASADLLLFPTETETFGNVLLEGMASGLLTVSYDYAASAAHVKDGINGHKVPKGAAALFVESAVRAIADERAKSIREAARETAESLSWEQIIEEFEGNFSRLTSPPPVQATEPPPRKKSMHASSTAAR